MSNQHLSTAHFQKAKAFIHANARPLVSRQPCFDGYWTEVFIHQFSPDRILDVKLYEYYFERGSAEVVWVALAAYQNEDGGFGHGIEPDFRLKTSSPMATSVGLQYATAVSTPTAHPIVQNAIRYLLTSYNSEYAYWPATFENVNDEPHAIWWHVNNLTPPQETAWPNPSAEIIGYLYHHADLVPPEFLADIGVRAQQNLAFSNIITGETPQKYNILCWERALPYLPADMKTAVTTAINRTFQTYGTIQPHTFEELSTLHFTPNPKAILAQLAPDTIAHCLDAEISQQNEDGGWWPGWHWGQYETVWPLAKQEWAGKITVENLHIFKQFGRLA